MKPNIAPENVHKVLGQRILTSGMQLVCDLERCHGNYLHDSLSGRDFLDMFTFYASRPLSFDHPALVDPKLREQMGRLAAHKPSNCDIYTVEYAAFIERFAATAGRSFAHAFVVSGGALAVENALKCAFDWKVRKNLAAGRGEIGQQVLHFSQSFHGRSGYTLSLTDSPDPRKTLYFPKFEWPRVSPPCAQFPLREERLARTIAAEKDSLKQIEAAFDRSPHEIAAILIEPIQGEGGDNHFRPEFLRALRDIADSREALLIFDEVQTGMGLTGAWWAHERIGVKPDLVVFGKKFQICGFAASDRIDDVDNVFRVPSRISSTFEGNIVDMVRSTRVLEVIEEEGLLEHAASEGEWLLGQLRQLEERHESVSQARGLGLMAAFDLPDSETRNKVIERCMERGMIILGCGQLSIRFRPSLDVRRSELQAALTILDAALG